MVLQGDGVTVELEGTTFISKTGITSTTFKTVPDVPFSTFELTLPQGRYSALTANLPASSHGSFCGQSLAMPTEFLAQNGLKINQSTKINVEGCSNSISLVSHSLNAHNLTVSVSVPAAGKLNASGNGLSTQTKTTKGRETITLNLSKKRAGKLRTTVKITFTSSTGKDRRKQSKTLKITPQK